MKNNVNYLIKAKGGKYHNAELNSCDINALIAFVKRVKKEKDLFSSNLTLSAIRPDSGSQLWSHTYPFENFNDISRDLKALSKGKTNLSWGTPFMPVETDGKYK